MFSRLAFHTSPKRRQAYSALGRYAWSLALFAAVLTASIFLWPLSQHGCFLLLTGAVVASAWFSGARCGIMVASLSLGSLTWLLAQSRVPNSPWLTDILRLAVFATVCALLVALSQQRHKAEDQLRASERQFRRLIENTSDIITILDRHGVIQYESPSVHRILGFEPGELIGRNVLELVHPDDIERTKKFFYERIHQPGVMPPFDVRFRSKNGSYRALEAVGNVLLNEPGIFGVVVASRDITERTRAAESFRALLESAPDAIIGVNAQGRIELVNSQTEQMFGYTREEMLGQPVEMLVPGRFRRQHEREREAYAGNPRVRPMGAGRELMARRKDGTEFPAEISLSPMESERGLLVTSIVRDITERKKAEAQRAQLIREQAARAEAEAAHHRFHALVQDLDAIVWEMDVATEEMTFVSERAAQLLGRPTKSWLGPEKGWLEHVHREHREKVLAFLRRVPYAGPAHMEYRAVSVDGRQLWLRLLVYVARGEENLPQQLRGLAVDITERRQAEESMRLSEKLAATGRLAASIAHEINNPIAAVTNLLYLINAMPDLDSGARHYVRLAQDELARVTHITRQMLAFYRDATAPVPLDINEVLENTLALYARRLRDNGIKVERELRKVPQIRAFPGEMRQVFSNLLLNAVEAVGQEGRIALRVRAARDWSDPQRTGIRVVFADNGSGIRPENRQRIFEPFFTTKGENGTGLGLWVSAGIVQKHGGRLRVWSSTREGRSGTCFSVFLPAAEGEEHARTLAANGIAS
ncbi:MAG: PAS domain S-box protein [Terriglobales bacterium]